MKRRGVTILFVICVILTTGFVFSAAIDEELHLNIQVINSSGDVETGTFDFEFNISTLEDCSDVVYTNFTNLTTDSRGIISYYLENVNLNFSSQYWLCYYRDGVLINASKIARTPYSFTAKNVSAEGIINDSNVNLVGYNVTASSGLFSWLGSLLNRITKLFVQDIDFTGNIIGTGDVNITGVMNASDYYTYDSHVGTIRLTEIGHDVTLALDDAMIHRTNLSITASAGVVTATIYNQDEVGGNIDYVVNKTRYSIADASTVTLVAGTWVSPQTNYLWVDNSQALESSITAPTGEYAWAGIVEVANVSGSVVEYYARQDEVPTIYEVIKNNYERAWYDNVLYESGIAITFTGEELATTSGNLRFALTSIPFVARNTSTTTKFIWMNNPDGAYSIHDDLDGIAKYQDGGSIGVNKYFSVVIFGLVEDDHQDNYYIIVQDEPGTEYRSVSSAEADTDSKVNYNFPSGYERTGFRIARVVLKHTAGDNEIQTLSNGLNYIQLLDETQIVLGGTSAIALGLDDVVDNNPNTDSNIISTANITADWFFGSQFNATGTSYFQDVDFNEGWLNGGVSISDGDLYAQTVWVYNLSSLNVNSLSINGSILPPVGFDNTFDIGNASLRWKDIYISGNLHSNGSGDNYFLGKVGIGTGSPGAKLHVNVIDTEGTPTISSVTTAHFQRAGTSGSSNYVSIQAGSAGLARLSFGDKDAQSSGYIQYNNSGNSLSFVTNFVEAMHIDSTQKVGIGTSSPDYKLNVLGPDSSDANNVKTGSQFAVEGSSAAHGIYVRAKGTDPGISGLTYANQIFGYGGNVGLEVYSNSQLILGSGNTERMRIDDTGNVGIGTTTPGSRLTINASGGTSATSSLNVTNSTGSPLFLVRDDGNVGIGTGSPEAKLDISSTDGTYLLNLNSTTDVNGGSAITFYKARDGMTSVADDDVIGNIRSTAYNGSEYVSFSNIQNRIDDFSNGIMNTSWRFNLVHNNAQIAVMRLTSSGNVGIGTASPEEKLHVKGAGIGPQGTEIKVEETNSSHWALFGMGTDNSVRAGYMLTYGSNHSSQANQLSVKNLYGNMTFFTGVGGSSSEKMRIDTEGNVGIGTSSPLSTLHVNSSSGGGIRLESSSTNKYGFISSKGNLHLTQNAYYNGTSWNTIETGTSGGFQTNIPSDQAFRVFSNTTSVTADSKLALNALMVVKTDGNVGIGTTTPTQKLHVEGNVNITGNITMGDAFMFTDGSGNMIFRI